jgi:hypothetical protein
MLESNTRPFTKNEVDLFLVKVQKRISTNKIKRTDLLALVTPILKTIWNSLSSWKDNTFTEAI